MSTTVSAPVKMLAVIPAMPVKEMARSVAFYRSKLGFDVPHQDTAFAILRRDAAEIHLWVAADESWRSRAGSPPVVSGAESFIAGTSSCRVVVENIDDLYHALQPLGIVHPNGALRDQPWGWRTFGVLDPDNNLITFVQRKLGS
jgi:catechol 2,3-dioxygenase-like lactoylglutathione lyase family enzyme